MPRAVRWLEALSWLQLVLITLTAIAAILFVTPFSSPNMEQFRRGWIAVAGYAVSDYGYQQAGHVIGINLWPGLMAALILLFVRRRKLTALRSTAVLNLIVFAAAATSTSMKGSVSSAILVSWPIAIAAFMKGTAIWCQASAESPATSSMKPSGLGTWDVPKKWVPYAIAVAAGAISVLVVEGLRSPKSLAECQAKAAQQARGDQLAVALALTACDERFEPRGTGRSQDIQLGASELAQLTGRAGAEIGNLFSGTIYNGNRTVRVTGLEIDIRPMKPQNASADSCDTANQDSINKKSQNPSTDPVCEYLKDYYGYRTYRTSVNIDPLSAGTFQFSFVRDDSPDYDWRIRAASGDSVKR